jgi:membrane-associated protease RseP (regulator of RpoE activity)
MDTIMIFDLSFLVIFTLAVILFLYLKRKNLNREGIMFLYRTKWGIRQMEKVSKKFPRTLNILKYVSIFVGFALMIVMFILLIQTILIYVNSPEIVKTIKSPPIMPLIPYFPQIFGMQSLMPPFYFIYFLVAILIVAISHEFSHGIFMKLTKVKIKSTGFVFLGPILGAFVEQDQKSMDSKKKIDQMAILSAGVFANVLMAVFFLLIMGLFFSASYAQSGYIFNDYAFSYVPLAAISGLGNTTENITEVYANQTKYLFYGNNSELTIVLQNESLENASLKLYENAPAIREKLIGAIVRIDNTTIKNQNDLKEILDSKKPGESINIVTLMANGEIEIKNVVLDSRADNSSKAYLGIVSYEKSSTKILNRILSKIIIFKDPNVFYTAKYNPQLTTFFYNLFWWIMMINIFVALFNMLPLGILDGGRFFFLAITGITGSEKIAAKSFKVLSGLIFLGFILMMVLWAIRL